MTLGNNIHRLRIEAKLTQEQLAEQLGVSQQSVGKWETDKAAPEIDKLIALARIFRVSLDMLVLGIDRRMEEDRQQSSTIRPNYEFIPNWELYSNNLATEFRQSLEEGLDLEEYRELFTAVRHLPKKTELRRRLGDILFELVQHAKTREDYPYVEPSELSEIQALRKPYPLPRKVDRSLLESKIHGAWLGRVCGCFLGKPLEGIRTDELIPFLKETGNSPLHRYVRKTDLTEEMRTGYKFPFHERCYPGDVPHMPSDDDTNYTVLAQKIIRKFGRDFTPFDVSQSWLAYQPKNAYCTAERVAFCNFIKGYAPPQSAVYQNPFREWIGAQIRADYFGYINPGDPETAAEMAWRDASISHVKNGIYGEMFVAAMLAVAATTTNMEDIIEGGLAQIPATSRLWEEIRTVLDDYRAGLPEKDAFRKIHERYNEKDEHDWCHTNSNARIVAAALLYGKGDYGRSICLAVECGFDTDCNGATVGSIVGMAYGKEHIPTEWSDAVHDTLSTTIFNIGTVRISECAKGTMEHIPQ